jgi:HPt (histidine-containing phosphotransfer) domain-containing protein
VLQSILKASPSMPLGPSDARSPVDGRTAGLGLAPAVDAAVFDELMAQLDDEDVRVRADMITSYLADAEDYLRRLVTAADAGDAVTAGICAHTLRSTSALLGATRLADLLQGTEDLAAASQPGDLAASAALADTEYQRVRGSLRLMRNAEQSRPI